VVSEVPLSALADYARVSPAFLVERVLDVVDDPLRLGHFVISERSIAAPFIKDYDATAPGGPLAWPHRFDLSAWTLFAARVDGRPVGWAAVAFDAADLIVSPGTGRPAVLWDIRVAAASRDRGVGSALFRSVVALATLKGCQELLVETQNINVSACRFYQRQGCELRAVNSGAYPEYPDETQLIWVLPLARQPMLMREG
jgi:GNAT superfamily N-acetyltransferase